MTDPHDSTSSSSRGGRDRLSKPMLILGGLTLLTGAAGLVFGLLVPSMRAASTSTTKAATKATLVEIGRALRAYAADFKGELPPNDEAITSQLVPTYLAAPPRLGPAGSPEPTWRFVPPGNLMLLSNPSTKILAFETPGHWPRAGGHLLYADGTVTWVDGLRFDEMVKPFMAPQ